MAIVIRRGSMALRIAATLVRPLLMAGTRRDWSGAHNLPRTRGFVVVANHLSQVDPFTLAHFLVDNGQVPHFLGKVEVFDLPLIGWVLRQAEQIPVYRESERAGDAYQAAVAAVKSGACVVILPEGTLTREPDLWPMRGKTGAARIALATGCPVIPVAQWGPQEWLPPNARLPSPGRHTMQVRAGAPVDLSRFQDAALTRVLLDEATETIMHAVTAQLAALRGIPAPADRFDPDAHGLTRIGRSEPRKE